MYMNFYLIVQTANTRIIGKKNWCSVIQSIPVLASLHATNSKIENAFLFFIVLLCFPTLPPLRQ